MAAATMAPKDGQGHGDAVAMLDGSPTPASGQSTASMLPLEVQEALLPKVVVRYQHPFSAWRRRYMVVLVSAITAFLCADQNLLAPNLSAAAAYFGLTDLQKDTYLGGYLMAAFFIVGAPAALVCGYLADKYNRVLLLTTIIIIGEAPCLATYWVTQLWQFFLVRMLTGIAVGGCFPLVFSLLGDLFPISQRSAMAALVQIAIGVGIGGGQMLAGIVGPATNWRMPFVVMAVPSLLMAVLFVCTVREPPRGGFEEALTGQLAEGAAYSETITWRSVRRLLAVPSNWIIILQGLPGCLPWGVMQTYINDYLHLNKGYSVEMSTVVILMFGIGCAVGVLAGGAAGQLLYNWRKESVCILTGLSVLAGAGPVYYLINADLQAAGFGVALFMSALAGALVSIAGPNLRAIMINVNTPETRGVSLALQSVTDDLGRGLGPVIVAGFISRLGRQGAFNVSVAGWVPCGIMLCCLVFTLRKDEAHMQRQLAVKAEIALEQVRVSRSSASGSPMSAQQLPPPHRHSSSCCEVVLPGTCCGTVPAHNSVSLRQLDKNSWPGARYNRGTAAAPAAASEVFSSASNEHDHSGGVRTKSRLSDPACCSSSCTRSIWCMQDSISRHSFEPHGSAEHLIGPAARTCSDGSITAEAVCSPCAVGISGSGTRHRGMHLRQCSNKSSSSDSTASHSRPGSNGMPVAEGRESNSSEPADVKRASTAPEPTHLLL